MFKYLAWALAVSAQTTESPIKNRQIRLGANGEVKQNGEAKQQPREINGELKQATNGDARQAPSTYVNNNNANSYGEPQLLKQNSLSVGLFKNGYAFYVQQYEVNSDGIYIVDLPSTVHGTLSVSSPDKDVSISTQFERVSVEAPLDASFLSRSKIQTSFAGKQITVQLKDSTVSGIVAKLAEPDQSLSSMPASSSVMSESYSFSPYMPEPSADFLVLEDAQGGLTMVDPASIVSFKVEGPAKPMKDDKRLSITVQGTRGVSAIQVSYLSYGVTWAPSYYLNVSDPSELSITFQAQIRNQGKALDASDVQLITGFPNLQFQSVASLLSSDLNTFIREANNAGRDFSMPNQGIMSQNVMSNSAYGMSQNVESTKVEADGSDVLYMPIGPLSLKSKSAVLKSVATAYAPFKQVVDWDASEEDAWDAIRFLNPLPSAITTAPVSVVQNGRLLGQSTSKWTPPKGLAIVRTSKALSIRVWKSETQGEELPLAPARAKLVQVNVEGLLNVINSRSTNVTMCLNYAFDGVLVPTTSARGVVSPKVSTVEGGSGGLNPRTNVNWEFFMAGGAKANVTFYYTYKKRVYY